MFLVTGCGGQLGQSLEAYLRKIGVPVTGCDRSRLDITDIAGLEAFFEQHPLSGVFNAAAYTAVDRAEVEVEAAFRINRDGVAALANLCGRFGIPLIHFSTDYVFDGAAKSPYEEGASPNPLNVYGASKLAGEEAFRQAGAFGAVIRISWLCSPYGRNFVKTIHGIARSHKPLRVVQDEIARPTFGLDAAAAAWKVMESLLKQDQSVLLHYAGAGEASWFEIAAEIVRQVGGLGEVEAVTAAAWTAQAQEQKGVKLAARPAYSVLSTRRIEQQFGVLCRPWKESLSQCLAELSL